MKRLSKEIEDIVIRYYKCGKSSQAIWKITGVGPATVINILRRRGEKVRGIAQHLNKCIECGKETGGKYRCKFHMKIQRTDYERNRYQNDLMYRKRRKRISREVYYRKLKRLKKELENYKI